MIVYVDLSAKVEQWTADSAVAVCNNVHRSYLVPSQVKQLLRSHLLEVYGSKSLQYRALAVLVYLVIRENLPQIESIIIDRDYTGPQVEATIKNVLLRLLRRDRPGIKAGFIQFENVKGSRADRLARAVFEGNATADRTVEAAEVEEILGIKKSRGRRRKRRS